MSGIYGTVGPPDREVKTIKNLFSAQILLMAMSRERHTQLIKCGKNRLEKFNHLHTAACGTH